MRRALAVLSVFALACASEPAVTTADTSCFGTRILSFRDLVGEVVIPSGEACAAGTFQLVFTRGADTLVTLTEERIGTVGFIGTADVNGDGRGEFFVATYADDSSRAGTLYGYTEGTSGIERFPMAALDSAQREGYTGGDRFGFGGADQLVRAFPRGVAGDTAWFGYSQGESRWVSIERPSWVR
jgi:hypothetical protein